jgi:hypothetical protein
MNVETLLKAAACGLAIWTTSAAARAQFTAPQNSLSFEDTGTLEAIQGDVMQIRDSKSEPWLLSIVNDTKVTVEGDAEKECLRPGVFVKFTAELDKKGAIREPIKEIELTSALGKASVGVFPEDDTDGLRPVRTLSAGKYLFKGKIASLKEDDLMVLAGRHKIYAKLSDEDLSVKLNVDDFSFAQPEAGDAVKVKAWYYDIGRPNLNLARPGKAMAEEVTITLAKPLAAGGKKPRQTERPSRPLSKSKVSR